MVDEKKDKKQLEKISLTKKETEDRALEVLDDDSLIEDDGDFFWILQRVIWGILKGVFLLAGIGFFIWFIWGDFDGFFSAKEVSQKVVSKVEPVIEKITDENIKTIKSGNYMESDFKTIEMIQKSYRLDSQQISNSSGILFDSVLWLKKAKSIGEISPQILRIESPRTRAKKIEEVLVSADKILKESEEIKLTLKKQMRLILRKKRTLEREIKMLDDQIFKKIKYFSPNGIDKMLHQKIEKEKALVEVSEQGKIRETLLKNIVNFEDLLKKKWIPLIRPTQIKSTQK